MRTAATISAMAVALAFGLAACGGGESDGAPTGSSPSEGAVVPGGGLSVREAIETDAEPPLAVAGWVVGSGEEARLCSGYDAAAEDPCVEPSLALDGDAGAASGERVSLFGAVDGDTFVVSSTVQG